MAFKTDALFAQLQAGIGSQGAELVPKIKGVYLFNITGGPDGAKKEWTINLKTGTGSVAPGKGDKPDVTLTISDADFLALAEGKANPQQLFMQGKIKMQGNMALAMKLQQVMDAKKASGDLPPPATAAPGAGGFQSDHVFEEIKSGIAADPSVAGKIKGVYLFVLSGDGGAKKEWTIDLKNGNGSVAEGKGAKADCTLTLSDENFVALAQGKANAQQLFMQGKVKLAGNMALAMKLEQVIKAKKPAAKL